MVSVLRSVDAPFVRIPFGSQVIGSTVKMWERCVMGEFRSACGNTLTSSVAIRLEEPRIVCRIVRSALYQPRTEQVQREWAVNPAPRQTQWARDAQCFS